MSAALWGAILIFRQHRGLLPLLAKFGFDDTVSEWQNAQSSMYVTYPRFKLSQHLITCIPLQARHGGPGRGDWPGGQGIPKQPRPFPLSKFRSQSNCQTPDSLILDRKRGEQFAYDRMPSAANYLAITGVPHAQHRNWGGRRRGVPDQWRTACSGDGSCNSTADARERRHKYTEPLDGGIYRAGRRNVQLYFMGYICRTIVDGV